MKKIALIMVLISGGIFAQNDLFDQVWYLYEVIDTDFGETLFNVDGYTVFGETYEVSPYVIIDSQLNFSGVGICDTFEGSLQQLPPPDDNWYYVIDTTITDVTCEIPSIDEDVVIGPFGVLGTPEVPNLAFVQVIDDPDGNQTMTFLTQPFIAYTYRNVPHLGTGSHTENVFSVYPNPTTDVINFSSTNSIIKSIAIIDSNGKVISNISFELSPDFIDVSSYAKGMYFIEIISEKGKEVHKFIKN